MKYEWLFYKIKIRRQGTAKLCDTLCETVSMYRECGEIESDWNCNLR